MHRRLPHRHTAGFTLVEVLVALVIFAILSALSYRSLSALLETKERIELETSRWREVMVFFNRFDQDIRRHIDRPVRQANGYQPGWYGKPGYSGDNDAQLMFSMLGNPEQPGTLMDSRRIGYRLNAGNIEELIWPAMDTAQSSKPVAYAVLRQVRQLSFRYMTSQGYTWSDRWPARNAPDGAIPKAVEIRVTLVSGETLNRIINLK